MFCAAMTLPWPLHPTHVLSPPELLVLDLVQQKELQLLQSRCLLELLIGPAENLDPTIAEKWLRLKAE
jgi:hypothetical protein